MKYFYLLSLIFSQYTYAQEIYSCSTTSIDNVTQQQIKKELKVFQFDNFPETCKKSQCKKNFFISGDENSHPYVFNFIAHNSKPPIVSVMIIAFKKNKNQSFDGTSLAETDYGNRLYTQVTHGSLNIFVECEFKRER